MCHAFDVVFEERNRVLSIALMEVRDSPGQLRIARAMPEYPPGAAPPRQSEQIDRYDNHLSVGGLIVVLVVVEVKSEVAVLWPNFHSEEP